MYLHTSSQIIYMVYKEKHQYAILVFSRDIHFQNFKIVYLIFLVIHYWVSRYCDSILSFLMLYL